MDPEAMSLRLTEHFTLDEFIVSQTAARLGIDNTPTQEIVDHLRHLCSTILEPARAALGPLHISSGYRCPALNVATKGAADSQHMLGYAADVIPANVTKLTLARWVVANIPDFDQVILEFGTPDEPAWIHASANPRARRALLRTVGGSYEVATL